MNKKLLVVTYYWPPSAGSGVQRWLKFVKYLPEFGWMPYVCTPENPAFDLRDETLLKDVPPAAEVLHLPISEPHRMFSRLTKNKPGVFPSEKKSLTASLIAFMRGNFFVPDPRIGWVRPAAGFLEDFIRHEKISHLITTGPPHSMHLIGLRLKKRIPSLCWVADFRDPWSEWHLLDELKVTAPVRWLHQRMEKMVLAQADKVLTVTPYLSKRFETLGGRSVTCITNGYDDDDGWNMPYVRTKHFTIRHTGLLRDAWPFLEAVKEAASVNDEFRRAVRVEFTGVVHAGFRQQAEADDVLRSLTSFVPYVPHNTLPALYAQTDVLLLVIPNVPLARGYLPGKLFEYLASKRPVIGLGPEDGDAAAVLRQAGAGQMAGWTNTGKIKQLLLMYFDLWKQGESLTTAGAPGFSRRQLTFNLAQLLEQQVEVS